MAPFSLEVELQAKPRLTGNDHYWSVIRKLGARGRLFTIADVVDETAAHRDSVGDFMRRLTRTSPPILEVAGTRAATNDWRPMNAAAARTFRLLHAPAATPSVRRDGKPGVYGQRRQNMWNILRGPQGRGGVDAQFLVAFASTDVLPIKPLFAREFLRTLNAAGYLRAERQPGQANHWRFWLKPSMNTGPEAPKLLHGTIIYDPNRKAVVGPLRAEESTS